MKLYNQVNRTEYTESDKAMPVIARVGTGGGNGSVVICSTKERSDRCAKMITRDRTGSTPIKTN